MRYELAISRTLRFSIEYEADDSKEAFDKAEEMFNAAKADPEQFDGADEEFDYALDNLDTGKILADWGEG